MYRCSIEIAEKTSGNCKKICSTFINLSSLSTLAFAIDNRIHRLQCRVFVFNQRLIISDNGLKTGSCRLGNYVHLTLHKAFFL